MKAVILAAGRGSRLREFTEDCPKCFNRVGGKTLLEWQISALETAGIEEIIVVTGYRSEVIENLGIKTIYNKNWEVSNMVTSLLCAKKEIEEPVIVSYSDIIYNPKIIEKLIIQDNDAVIAFDPNWERLWSARFMNPIDDAESFQIDGLNRITEIGKHVNKKEDIKGQYMGLMKYTPQCMEWIEEYVFSKGEIINNMDMTSLLGALIQLNYNIFGMPVVEDWFEVDTPKDLELANKWFKKGKLILT